MGETTFPRTIPAWLTATGVTEGSVDHSNALFIVSDETQWVCATAADVIGLGAALWKEPPRATPGLTPVQALALASEMAKAEVAPNPSHDAFDSAALAKIVRARVTALQRQGDDNTNTMLQKAAFAAVRQLGGWRKVGIQEWMENGLADVENWTACDCFLERVETACRQTSPGRSWRYVYGLGVITYQGS